MKHAFFLGVIHLWRPPDIDCFTTKNNTQLLDYISYKPDPFAKFVDAFSINWSYYNCYIFPLFSLMGQVLQKIQNEKAEVLLMAPYWPTQPWFNTLYNLIVGSPMIIKPHENNLILPYKPLQKHPLHKKLTLIVGKLSNRNTSVQDMIQKQ